MSRAGLFITMAAMVAATDAGAAARPPAGPEGLIVVESQSDVAGTEARAKAALAALGVPVFATFDHGANAAQAGLALRPTVVLVFGNPRVGTKLMQDQQAMALDLPLRLAIWQDAQGKTWVGYHDVKHLAASWGITDTETATKLAGFMGNLVEQATRK